MPVPGLRFQGAGTHYNTHAAPQPTQDRPLASFQSQMTTLPSFVELMASLGLENGPDATTNDQRSLSSRHSRSSSRSSISSLVSQSSAGAPQSQSDSSMDSSPCIIVSSDSVREMDMDRRRYRTRFAPYTPAISHARRVSLPEVVNEEEIQNQTSRALSTSPRSMSPLRNITRRSSTLGLSTGRRPEKLTLDPDFVANTPISTFLRRKTPQSSPISPTFPHRRKRSSSPSLPVSIPTLPTFCFPPQPSTLSGCVSSDTDDDAMSDASSTRLDVDNRRKRRSRKAHTIPRPSGHSLRRPRSGEDHYRLAPLA